MENKFSMKDQKCEQVTVFQDRAEVKRSIQTKISKGETEITINNVSNYIDEDSIRVEGQGDSVVLDVVCQNKIVEAHDMENNSKIKELKHLIKQLTVESEKIESKKARLTNQKDTLNQFAKSLATPKSNGSDEKNMPNSREYVDSFFEFLNSYTDRLVELDEKLAEVKLEKETVEEKLCVAEENLNKFHMFDDRNEARLVL